MRAMTWFAVALTWAMTGAATARSPIEVAPTAVYTHAPAGITVPAALDGLPRAAAMDMGDTPSVDVGLEYSSPDRKEVTSVYVFRLVIGSPEVWFDRALFAVAVNKQLGTVQPAPIEMFVAPGARVPNSLRDILAVEGGPMRSTAVAMVPVDGWMITLRLSSATLDKDALRARLERTIAAISWPSFAKARPIVPMTRCAEPLNIANPAKPLGGDSVVAGLVGALVFGAETNQSAGGEQPAKPVRWCRDAFITGGVGIYRRNEEKDNYVLALGDGGVGMSVNAADLPGTAVKSWAARLVQLDRQIIFPYYDNIPQPQQVVALLQGGKPISTAMTWPKRGEVTLTMPPN